MTDFYINFDPSLIEPERPAHVSDLLPQAVELIGAGPIDDEWDDVLTEEDEMEEDDTMFYDPEILE